MKRSNIFIISGVFLIFGWLVVSVRMQAKAYSDIRSNNLCSYAEVIGLENGKNLQAFFKNIKIDFETNSTPPELNIQYGKIPAINISNGFRKSVFYEIKQDTLMLYIKYVRYNVDNKITINLPELNCVKLISGSSNTSYSDFGRQGTFITDFRAKQLTVINDCQFHLTIQRDTLQKLVMRGDFFNSGHAEIMDYGSYDSLDVDIQGKGGKLFIGSIYGNNTVNPKQWISIKVPATFRVDAEASLAGKIFVKK